MWRPKLLPKDNEFDCSCSSMCPFTFQSVSASDHIKHVGIMIKLHGSNQNDTSATSLRVPSLFHLQEVKHTVVSLHSPLPLQQPSCIKLLVFMESNIGRCGLGWGSWKTSSCATGRSETVLATLLPLLAEMPACAVQWLGKTE